MPILEPDEKVDTPAFNVPDVLKFYSPNDIRPSVPESVIEPSAIVTLPIDEPDPSVDCPALNVPVVDKFSSPNDILPPESVI